jgi:hypothetical protein
MDKNFQTSFLPKKPLNEPVAVVEKTSLGIFGFIGIVVFIITAGFAGGVYFYEANLSKQLAEKQQQLNNARNILESPLIGEAKILGRRIADANQILANHIIVSPIFEALELNTLKSLQFNNFSYVVANDASGKVAVEMTGLARDYTSIALESDQLAKNKDIQNPIFSGLALDSKTGNVTFNLKFTVNPDFVNFGSHISKYQDATSTIPATNTTPGIMQ